MIEAVFFDSKFIRWSFLGSYGGKWCMINEEKKYNSVVSLRKMGHIRSFCCCDKRDINLWRATSLAIGWFALIASTWLVYEVILTPARDSLVVSIIYTILIIFLNVNVRVCKYMTILLCGESNFIDCSGSIWEFDLRILINNFWYFPLFFEVVHWAACAMWLCGNAKVCAAKIFI